MVSILCPLGHLLHGPLSLGQLQVLRLRLLLLLHEEGVVLDIRLELQEVREHLLVLSHASPAVVEVEDADVGLLIECSSEGQVAVLDGVGLLRLAVCWLVVPGLPREAPRRIRRTVVDHSLTFHLNLVGGLMLDFGLHPLLLRELNLCPGLRYLTLRQTLPLQWSSGLVNFALMLTTFRLAGMLRGVRRHHVAFPLLRRLVRCGLPVLLFGIGVRLHRSKLGDCAVTVRVWPLLMALSGICLARSPSHGSIPNIVLSSAVPAAHFLGFRVALLPLLPLRGLFLLSLGELGSTCARPLLILLLGSSVRACALLSVDHRGYWLMVDYDSRLYILVNLQIGVNQY